MPSSGEQEALARLLASEIAESCAIGDHTTLSRPALRGIVGFGALLVGAVRKRRFSATEPIIADTILIAANPVAHGARLVTAVRQSLGESVEVVADTRFAAVEVDQHFPGVSMVSLARETSWGSLRFAFAARRNLPKGIAIPGAKSRLYAEYLFVAQAIRYSLASAAIEALPENVLVLTDFDRHTFSRPWIWAANKRGLATATLIHGSPNAKTYLPFLAKHVFVWGEVQAAWVRRHAPNAKATIVGRADMSRGLTMREGNACAILCHSREILSDIEADQLRRLLLALRLAGNKTVLRLHPSATLNDLDDRWKALAALCDSVLVGSGSLTASLNAADIVVSVASSSVIDALAMEVRGVVVSDRCRPLPADLEAIRASSAAAILEILAGREMTLSTLALSQSLVSERGRAAAGLLRDAVRAAIGNRAQ